MIAANEIQKALASAIHGMALLQSDAEREELRRNAQSHSMSDWKTKSVAKVAGVGGLTGLAGGPIGLALEAADLAYLFSAAGRACYGVGHILGAEIDYENDIQLILAVWTDAAEVSGCASVGKVAVKVGGKAGIKVAGKSAAKIMSKVAVKGSTKAANKIIAKVGAKLLGKLTTKVAAKWIPFVGGAISAGINYWVADGLMSAAERYYSNEYLLLGDELAEALTD